MSPQKTGWCRIEEMGEHVKFWRAGSSMLTSDTAADCPRCDNGSIRYYAHHFSQHRSAIWVWCVDCMLWTVASNMKLNVEFFDPCETLSPSAFEQLEREGWIERLNDLWEQGRLIPNPYLHKRVSELGVIPSVVMIDTPCRCEAISVCNCASVRKLTYAALHTKMFPHIVTVASDKVSTTA